MNKDFLLACGVLWRNTADLEAGWQLVDGLESRDPQVRLLAHAFLVEGGDESMRLLEEALSTGTVSTEIAGRCIAELLGHDQHRKRPGVYDRTLS